ncbi:diaminobutyrate-2-oxoglutarate transaminase [Bradyrhizobium sp. USDA 4369]
MNMVGYLASVESNARTYAATFRRTFVSGRGIRVRDSEGNEYLDCLACAGALPLGHNHPEIREAVLDFVKSDQIEQGLDLTTPAKAEFVQELFSHLPVGFRERAKIHFCGPTGSDGVEAAMKLMKVYTKRTTVLAFQGAYHGMTKGALGAMGNLTPKSGIGLVPGDVHFLPYPYRFRCPFGTNGDDTDRLSINYIRHVLTDPEGGVSRPAALLVEAVQGEGGCIPASENWLRAIRQLTLEHDVPLIIDEVQTGLGRTGMMFAFERAGIVPDAIVLSKAVGGGYPLSVVVYDRKFDVWSAGMHAGTFRGNQVGMVAGRAAMRVIARDRLSQNAARVGEILKDGLSRIARRFEFLGEVRGHGLMLGVEIVRPDGDANAGHADGATARMIKLGCFRNGVIVETGGRHGAVLRFLPPLIATQADVEEILERFERAVTECQPNAVRELVALS